MSAKIPKVQMKGYGSFTPPPKPEPAISIPNVTLPESVFLTKDRKYKVVITRENEEQPPEK